MQTNIIKTRKTSNYTQIHNLPLQSGLKRLEAIGLLGHLMSLPDTWTIYKTQLQTLFGRGRLDTAWKILIENNYGMGFAAHAKGHKGKVYFYVFSDKKFTQNDFDNFVKETIEELKNKGEEITMIETLKDSTLTLPTVCFTAEFQQQKVYSKNPTTINKDLKKKYKKRNIKDVVVDAPTQSVELTRLINLFEKNICKLNDKNKKDLADWLDRLPYELIESEILYSAEHSARSFAYLDKILKDNLKRGLTDLPAAEEARRIHTDKNKRTI